MAIYAISDLHLSFGIESKPMDIFGKQWEGYVDKIVENWKALIRPEDIVIMAGDFSWATYIDEAKKDFEFLAGLPGRKIILKGNHDYWWTTIKKMNEFIKENNFENIYFLHNNAIDAGDYVIAGTRYWAHEEDEDNEKIFNRECQRAEISINDAKNIAPEKPIIMVTHYPPDERIIKRLAQYDLDTWIYGHIHSNYEEGLVNIEGINTYLTSCDYLDFEPKLIKG